jgi:hypothetical protein
MMLDHFKLFSLFFPILFIIIILFIVFIITKTNKDLENEISVLVYGPSSATFYFVCFTTEAAQVA